MPGLIDCHVHCMHSDVYMRRLEDVPLTLATARGAVRLRSMLDRGFTTVRDTGGTDWGVKAVVEQGLIVGPRLFIAGRRSEERRVGKEFVSTGRSRWSP